MPYPTIVRSLADRETACVGSEAPSHIAACVDTSPMAQKVVAHATALAGALRGDLTLLRVLQPRPTRDAPADPVEWEIRRREAWNSMERMAEAHESDGVTVEAKVIEGQPAEQICLWAEDHDVDLTVIGTHGENYATGRYPGKTARDVVESGTASFLLVPRTANDAAVRYRRILVPLDGSSRAESVLPLAMRLARAHRGELVLVHIVPSPEMTEVGPLEEEALELRGRTVIRNERIAREYLDRVRGRLLDQGVSVRRMVLRDGDVSRRLAKAIVDEAADLVVLSAHGRGGHADVPHGSTTAYQLAHPTAPLLIVNNRPSISTRYNVATWGSAGLRLPEQASV